MVHEVAAERGHTSVVGVNTGTLPNPLPAGNIATFTIATPIAVSEQVTSSGSTRPSRATCYYSSGST